MKLDLNNPAHRNPAILKLRDVDATVLQYFPNPLDTERKHVFIVNGGGGLSLVTLFDNGKVGIHDCLYRSDLIFKPDAIVPFGHNLANITFEQLGEEYRLLNWDEIKDRDKELKEIEIWSNGDWISEVYGSDISETYRTKLTRKQLAALTEEQVKEEHQPTEKPFWNCLDDVPLTIKWIRYNVEKPFYAVVTICDAGLIVVSNRLHGLMSWQDLQSKQWSDGTTWKECRCE